MWKVGEGVTLPSPLPISPLNPQPGTYCCGPVPVRAIKEGDLNTKYDAPFVFAEVNADVVNWIQQKDGSMHESTNTALTVGMKISTKRVGRDEREDITHNYKYPEGRCWAHQSLCQCLAGKQPVLPASGLVCVCLCVCAHTRMCFL